MTENNDNSSKSKETSQSKEDEELSALLESALEDFNTTEKPKENQSGQDEKRPEPPSSLWNDEFLRETAARFQQSIFSPGPDGTFTVEQLGESIQSLAEAATQTAGFDASPDTEFSGIIAQILKNLSENLEGVQGVNTDEDIMNMLGRFGNLSDPNKLVQLMQQMMQNLLSKDILYPALSSIVEKYPKWLEENKSKLSSAEYDRYSEQFAMMKDVCDELHNETADDSEDVKNARFEKILALMTKIQDCGLPPSEITGEFTPMLQSDLYGNLQLPPNMSPSQCSLM